MSVLRIDVLMRSSPFYSSLETFQIFYFNFRLIIHFIFIIIFIVFAYSKIVRVGKHFSAFFSIVDSNARVTKNCIGNFTGVSKKECVVHCINDKRCQTFNYNYKEEICETLSVSKFDGVGFLERQKHWAHYETDCNQKKVRLNVTCKITIINYK